MSKKSEPKKREEKKIHTYFEIKGDKLNRRLKKCPRCGSFMALHKSVRPRWTCGKCSYTDYSGIEKTVK